MLVKSLVDGSEVPIISDDYSRWYPRWSPDGKQLAYDRRNRRTNERQLMLWSSQSHEEKLLCSNLGLWDWSPDGKWLLAGTDEGGICLIPVAAAPHAETAAQKIASPDPAHELYQPQFSPDSRWIVLEAVANSPTMTESALFVVPVAGGAWRRITDGKYWDDKPRWSPDGKTIYFISRRGGFFNVWGIHFDPDAGKPVGQPFQLSKFESARLMVPRFIPPVGLSLTGQTVLTMAEESGQHLGVEYVTDERGSTPVNAVTVVLIWRGLPVSDELGVRCVGGTNFQTGGPPRNGRKLGKFKTRNLRAEGLRRFLRL